MVRKVTLFVCAHSAALFLAAAPARSAFNPVTDGVGLFGDSLADEYQFYPPDKPNARTFGEILAVLRGFNLGEFTTDFRLEPRNQGYEFNWARDTARTSTLLSAGQHTGLAQQASQGNIKLVLGAIGGNDFRDVFFAPDPLAALQAVVPQTLTNVNIVIGTILAADPSVNVVVANVPDLRHIPELKAAIGGGLIPQAFADAVAGTIAIYNDQLAMLDAASPRVAVADTFGLFNQILASPEYDEIGGVTLERNIPGSFSPVCDPRFLFVDPIHPGTIGQGLFANEFIRVINTEFGGSITPLSETEIVSYATTVCTPEPGLLGLCVIAGLMLARRRTC